MKNTQDSLTNEGGFVVCNGVEGNQSHPADSNVRVLETGEKLTDAALKQVVLWLWLVRHHKLYGRYHRAPVLRSGGVVEGIVR